jgi:hypothetical protein
MLDKPQFKELLLQALEYRDDAHNDAQILERVLQKLAIDAEQPTPGRGIVRTLGEALVAESPRGR